MSNLDIALVGYEPPGSENLALRVLAAEAISAGFKAAVYPISSLDKSQGVIAKAIRKKPGIIGLSLLDTVSAIRTLPLAGLARKKGYAGFIVCGGPFVTLQTDWVLHKAPAVDGVVRHAGEGPLLNLLQAVKNSTAPEQAPGIVTRSGPNNPVEPSLAKPSAWLPLRGPRPKIMGVPTAEIMASIGCKERCDYCTHAAVASIAVREYRDAGVSSEALKASGLGQLTRRPYDSLIGEMAQLYHDDGVRYFQFIDENPVPEREEEALEWIGGLKHSFGKKDIGPIALSMMTRGDALTEPVIDALVDLGMVRTLIGIESGTTLGLEALGRTGKAKQGRRSLQLLEERGVVSMFNSLMIHPDSTMETVKAELDFLGTIGQSLFETVEAAPFTGTTLNKRMQSQGRLYGGVLLPMFSSSNEALERFRILRGRLRTEALGGYTPTFRVHDLLLSAVILRRVGGQTLAGHVERKAKRLIKQINESRLNALLRLHEAAEHNSYAGDIIRQAAVEFRGQRDQLLRLCEELKAMAEPGESLSRHCRNFAAAAALVFSLSSTPGCSKNLDAENLDAELDGGTDKNTVDDSGTDTDVDADIDADADGDSDADGDADSDADTDTDEDVNPNIDGCEDRPFDENRLYALVQENCVFEEEEEIEIHISIGSDGTVEKVDMVSEEEKQTGEEPAWVDEMVECYMELLENEEFPCLEGEDVDIWIRDWGTPI